MTVTGPVMVQTPAEALQRAKAEARARAEAEARQVPRPPASVGARSEAAAATTPLTTPVPATVEPAVGVDDPTERESEVDANLRLYYEGGIQPLAVPLKPLSQRSSRSRVVTTVYEFYSLACGLRWAVEDHRPVLFTSRWVAKWCRLPGADGGNMAAFRAIRTLKDEGTIRHDETMPGNGAFCYSPVLIEDDADETGPDGVETPEVDVLEHTASEQCQPHLRVVGE
jgi:hypothetical protein